MGELRLNAVRTDTNESVDFIDLREPITADKITRGRDALKARVGLALGQDSLSGLIEIVPDTHSLPEPSDFSTSEG